MIRIFRRRPPPRTTLIFLDIPEDVIYCILCLCDISSVIRISQANKYLHNLAFSPTVWMSIIGDLRHRGFVDRPSTTVIRPMTTQSLVAVVKRLVMGPNAWSPPPPPPRPTSVSRILKKLGRSQGRRASDPSQVQCTILRGGKYVLFFVVDAQDLQILGCWRVADDSFVGIYRSALPSHSIRDFEAEVLDGGEHANIVLTLDPRFVEVISWDFATGVIELLSRTEHTGCTFWTPKICSDIAAAHVYHSVRDQSQEGMYVIIDWRAQQYCEILPPRHNVCLELIPGHLILTWSSGMIQEIGDRSLV
ncbi:hypothetical protein C8R44DRAFT_727254 [Mycena epipterygia]|nr:hypothetical protein C8R44DRAFT_727254 [Mycena epipterygia]